MWWQTALNIIGVVGSILSAVGVYVAIRQINQTKKVAQAALEASEATQRGIASNVILADMSSCMRVIEEIKTLLRSRRYESALMRVTDLTGLIIQLQHLAAAGSERPDLRAREALTSLSVLRDLLELKLDDDSTSLEVAKVNSELSKIADRLGHWIGRRKFEP
jgi:hypothetical protein